MTRQDVVRHLRDLVDSAGDHKSAIRLVDESSDGRLMIEAEGERYDITISLADPAAGTAAQRDDFASLAALGRSIDDAQDKVERTGPVEGAELRQTLDEAIARGARRWAARHLVRE